MLHQISNAFYPYRIDPFQTNDHLHENFLNNFKNFQNKFSVFFLFFTLKSSFNLRNGAKLLNQSLITLKRRKSL